MTGTVLCDPDPEPTHVRVQIELGGGSRLAIVDPRRFGTGELLLGGDALEEFFAARLGLEPLDERFTAAHLRTLARGRSAPIKAFLLDQRRVAGVGNIYADEALYRAGIHPLRPAGRLSAEQYRVAGGDDLGAPSGYRGARSDDRRFPPRGRRLGLFSGSLSGASPRGRAVRSLWPHDREDGGGRAGNLRLRDLPAASARRARRRPGRITVGLRNSLLRAGPSRIRAARRPAARRDGRSPGR